MQWGMQYAVGVGTKRSYLLCTLHPLHTVNLLCESTTTISLCLSRCWCKKVNSHGVLSKYRCWGPLPLVQKTYSVNLLSDLTQPILADSLCELTQELTEEIYSVN